MTRLKFRRKGRLGKPRAMKEPGARAAVLTKERKKTICCSAEEKEKGDLCDDDGECEAT